ncbi:Calpain-D [Penaeus vannamei]|uniref:Calpain-D n=1 Tax=Penaeus vannamei TaxID=6689 RepID=A0A3R7MHT4_PENVA|nr:Calpain-D [Penaeus vannamei]
MCGSSPTLGDVQVSWPGNRTYRGQSELMDVLREMEEHEALNKWTRIVQYCKVNQHPFVDDSFPPVPKSLFYNSSEKKESRVTQWLRPHEIVADSDARNVKWAVFRTPLPSDISQVSVSVLSSVRVREADQGSLCARPVADPAVALIRGRLHLRHDGSRTRRYYDSGLGHVRSVGAPCESLPLQASSSPHEDDIDEDLIWAQLLSSRSAGFLMGASCGGGNMKVVDEEYKAQGLRPRHAYSVLDVQDVGGFRLLQLRNPWGHYSWRGTGLV